VGLPGKGVALNCLALSPDDRTVAAGDVKGGIRLWDVATGKAVGRFSEPNQSDVHSLTCVEGGKLLVSGHWNGTIHVWNAAAGKVLDSLPSAASQLRMPAFAADGKLAVATPETDTVTLWTSLRDKQPVKVKLPARVEKVQFTPDGKTVAAGGLEGPVILIEFAASKVARTVGRADTRLFAVSPDGRLLATYGDTLPSAVSDTGQQVECDGLPPCSIGIGAGVGLGLPAFSPVYRACRAAVEGPPLDGGSSGPPLPHLPLFHLQTPFTGFLAVGLEPRVGPRLKPIHKKRRKRS
jgi:hypothetical protein